MTNYGYIRPTHSTYGVGTTFPGASVAAAVTFYTTNISTDAGQPDHLWVQYATATNSALNFLQTDASGSANTSLRISALQSTLCSAGITYTFEVIAAPNASWNFSPTVGGTVILFQVFRLQNG